MNSIVFNLFLGVSLLVVGYLAAPLVINEQTSPSSYLLSNEHVTSSSMDDMETYSSTVDSPLYDPITYVPQTMIDRVELDGKTPVDKHVLRSMNGDEKSESSVFYPDQYPEGNKNMSSHSGRHINSWSRQNESEVGEKSLRTTLLVFDLSNTNSTDKSTDESKDYSIPKERALYEPIHDVDAHSDLSNNATTRAVDPIMADMSPKPVDQYMQGHENEEYTTMEPTNEMMNNVYHGHAVDTVVPTATTPLPTSRTTAPMKLKPVDTRRQPLL